MKALLPFLALTAATLAEPTPFEVRVTAPPAGTFADQPLQDAIDSVAAREGGVVLLSAGEFKLSRHVGDETIIIKSGVTLRGQGFATHLLFDPATPANPARYFPVRIGSEDLPASNVVIEDLRYTANDQRIGGGSVMGFNARLGTAAKGLSSDNITIRHCWIYDAKQGAGCTKANPWEYALPERQAAQSKNWQVYGNYFETCGNKMVEFADNNGGLIADNYITGAAEGPQVIFGTRNVTIRDNEVRYLESGINVTEGSHHIRITGNHAEPMDSAEPNRIAPALLFRTEPAPLHSSISDVVVTNNVFRNQTTTSKCTVRFQTRKEALSCTYQGLVFSNNVFDGDLQFFDTTTPARTDLRDILFTNNLCEGQLRSVPNGTMKTAGIIVRDNLWRSAEACTLNADGWLWSGNQHPTSSLKIATGATGNIVRDNVTASQIEDTGARTVLLNNLLLAAPK